MPARSVHRVALAGNPNTGKTSVFNALTRARQKVGNYPGVPVEKREGRFVFNGVAFEILDLPGTYSLSSYSPEERIAQDELLYGTNDVVVVIADATNLKRSLILLAQIEAALQSTHLAPSIRRWVANRLLVGDEQFVARMQEERDAGIRALRVARRERNRGAGRSGDPRGS
jgi:tRNA U34 5-carboxymethylaminomethyl modifying GTPase MnmE/TrmE